MSRLQRLELRRSDPSVKVTEAFDVYRALTAESEAVRYAIGAMQPIDPEYTANTFAQGERVKNQLEKRLSESCEYEYQGSTTNDTHIKARSDIDLLVFTTSFHWTTNPTYPISREECGRRIRKLFDESVDVLERAFPEVDVDGDKPRSISMEGGSLTRLVDVVPASWNNTEEWLATKNKVHRGVKIFDRVTGEFCSNKPFLYNARIDERDRETGGGLRRAIRLMKSLRYDTETFDMSSYNIASLAWNMPVSGIAYLPGYELRILEGCVEFCQQIIHDDARRQLLLTPDGGREIFGDSAPLASKSDLQVLTREMIKLKNEVLNAANRSFQKLSEARVSYPEIVTRTRSTGQLYR